MSGWRAAVVILGLLYLVSVGVILATRPSCSEMQGAGFCWGSP